MALLRKKSDTAPSFADLLPWGELIGSGLVRTKDGSFIAGWYFRPPDTASATDAMQEGITASVNKAMLELGTGWSSWTDVISTPSSDYTPPDESFFPDRISRAVDNERREAFEAEGEHFENERIFLLCLAPPNEQTSKIEHLMYGSKGKRPSMAARLEENFKKAIQKFEDNCGDVIGMRRMQSFGIRDVMTGRLHLQDELVNYLSFLVGGVPGGVTLPAAGAYLDSVVGSQDFWTGETPLLGQDYICCISIDGFPAESQANILANLSTLDAPYRFNQRAIYMDLNDAKKEIGKYKRKWKQKVKGVWASLANKANDNGEDDNENAADMWAQAKAAENLVEGGQVLEVYYSATVVLRHPDREILMDLATKFGKAIRNCQFGFRIETVNTVEAFLGTLPGNVTANVRRPPISSANLCDLLPLSGIWTGYEHNPCHLYPPGSPCLLYAKTVGSIPFRLNVHVRDKGHTFAFGPTGAGKSTLLNTVAIQALRYPNAQIWAFDYKRGMYATAKACGGKHFELGNEKSLSLCPLSVLETEDDITWAAEWIEVCYELQVNKPLSPGQRSELNAALKSFAKTDKDKRSLTEFMMHFQDAEAVAALQYYTVMGTAGRTLDAQADNIAYSHFNVFETFDLMGKSDKYKLPVLLYLFRRFERSLDGRPTWLILDEAWIALGNKVWREKLEAWLRLLRSKNCAVIMASQLLSDAFKSGMLTILVEACDTKIWLGNPSALNTGSTAEPGPLDLYQAMQLNENQIEIIRTAEQKKEYYVTSPEGCRLIDLNIGPLAMAFAGATSEADVNGIRELVEKYDDLWVWMYLDDKGVDYVKYL